MLKKITLHKIILFLLLIFGFSVSIAGYRLYKQDEQIKTLLGLQEREEEITAMLLRELEALGEVLYGIRGLILASNYVDSEEFKVFVESVIPRHQDIKAILWVPYVDRTQRKVFEQQAKSTDGYEDFQINQRNAVGELEASPEHDFFYPVYHIYALDQSKPARGFDLNSVTDFSRYILEQSPPGELQLYPSKNDGKNSEIQDSFELILPVYKHPREDKNLRPKISLPQGFLIMEVSSKLLIVDRLKKFINDDSGLDIYLFNQNKKLMYFHPSEVRPQGDKATALSWNELIEGPIFQNQISFAGEKWDLILKPTLAHSNDKGRFIAEAILLLGFAVTILITANLYSYQRRNRKIEALVQKRSQELQKVQLESRAVLNTVVDGIITIDDHGIIQSANTSVESLFGYSLDKLIGNNIKMLMPENIAQEHDRYLANYLTTGIAKIIGTGREVEGKHKDGRIFPIELAVSEMENQGSKYFVGSVRDISERKKIEQMKKEFVSTVSHELRTPLTSIRGGLNLVLGKASEGMSEKAKEMLKMAARNCDRLTLLINDILDLEKIESGSLQFQFKSVDLIGLTHSCIKANEGYANSFQVKLLYKETLKQALVFGDDHRLNQVLSNLISNAVKFSPQNGTVEINVSNRNGYFRVSVIDHGCGIPESFHDKIFQRFSQADSSDTRQKGGTGLGLSISKAIIERHDGKIDFHSEQGIGSEFYFELPVRKTLEESQKERKHLRPKVLICEDNPHVAHILSSLLADHGYRCDIADTAQETEELLEKNEYGLLLLDLILPDKNGLVLLRELRDKKSEKDLPIIVLSGKTDVRGAEFNGSSESFIDWLTRPIDKDNFVNALKKALENNAKPRVLHIEDDPDVIQVTKALLEDEVDFDSASSLKEARIKTDEHNYDLILLDLGLPDGSGTAILTEFNIKCPVVIFSGLEISTEISNQVDAALLKSKTSNEQLLNTIKKILNKKGKING